MYTYFIYTYILYKYIVYTYILSGKGVVPFPTPWCSSY